MNILHMKYAVEVANTRSISKAAENLYTSQPNLSRAIKALENDLKIVDCVVKPCSRECESLFVWRKLYDGINEILDNISLYDAVFNRSEDK